MLLTIGWREESATPDYYVGKVEGVHAVSVLLFSDLAIEAMASGPEQKEHAQFKFTIEASILHFKYEYS